MSDAREKGTIAIWNHARNFGWIQKAGTVAKTEDGKLDTKDLIFVHTTAVQRGDSKTYNLPKGLEVEFTLEDAAKGPRATNVTMPGGGDIKVDGGEDMDVDASQTYTGKIIFYNSRKGFGFVKPDSEIKYKGLEIDQEKGIFVASSYIHAERPFRLAPDTPVQFKVYKDNGDPPRLAACQVEDPEGNPLKSFRSEKGKKEPRPEKAEKATKGGEPKPKKEEVVVNEKGKPCDVSKTDRHAGMCRMWNYRRRFGFIKPDNEQAKLDGEDADLSEGVAVHYSNVLAETNRGQLLCNGQRVSFTLTKTEKGYSALEVTQEDNCPVTLDVYKAAQKAHRAKVREEKAAKAEDAGEAEAEAEA